MDNFCEWIQDRENNYETSCGHIYRIIEGTPTENEMNFCTYCGKQIIQERNVQMQNKPKVRLSEKLADRPARWSMRYAPGWERINDSETGRVYWVMWTHHGLEILQYQLAMSYVELNSGGARWAAQRLRYGRYLLSRAKATKAKAHRG